MALKRENVMEDYLFVTTVPNMFAMAESGQTSGRREKYKSSLDTQ